MRLAARLLSLLMAAPAFAQGIPPDQRQSGFAIMSPDTQAMQNNDRQNPAMLSVAEGERLWNLPAGERNIACTGCHGDARTSMAGVAARYPAVPGSASKPRDIDAQIQFCRSENQKAPPFAAESRPLLAMSAFIGLQSRGQPITPSDDKRLQAAEAQGRALYSQRIGQLNLSCAGCHDDNWGKRLGGSLIPQAHPTAYPIYRLEWQGMGSFQRRLRNCMTGVRAEPYPYGADELVALEVYLKRRAEGMALETPGVRP